MPHQRTSPDSLLENIQNEEKKSRMGKLKIYLGSAPGVGKTYEMLHDALESRSKNLDVVVGVVESHGRQMIEEMLQKFEVIPRQEMTYRNKICYEFDLDAVLKRDPGLVLVDEMAHTNIPGLRHEKRWQDIKELLDRGIDVYTTLNVQHIESLKDDVAQIIQAPVKETVPDFMLELADTIELVDLPVDDLLKRLQEGKIYIPAQAEQASEHFFRRGNLIALRELALRTTAACVETEVLLYRKSEGIKQIWATSDKILVCVGSNAESLKLIRTAKRMANGLQAEWIAVYVDMPRLQDKHHERHRAIEHLRLAQQLGAETHVLMGTDVSKEILQFARDNNVTQIMVWKCIDKKRLWRHLFKHDTADAIVAKSGDINVFIVTGDSIQQHNHKRAWANTKISWQYYALSIFVVMVATGINRILFPYVDVSNLMMIYLLGIALVSIMGRIGPTLLASMTSILAYDFFFLKPIDTFFVFDGQHIITLLMFFIVTQIISYLTLLKHRKAQLANQIQQQTRALYTFSRQLLSTRGTDKVLTLGMNYIEDVFKATVMVYMPRHGQLELRDGTYSKQIPNEKERSVAQWVYDMGQPAGLGTDTLASSEALYLPLLASDTTLGVLKVKPKKRVLYSPEQMRLLESCIHQLSLALEVDRLQEKTRKKELKVEVDTARDMLLKTISDHLNFPLQGILNILQASNGRVVKVDRQAIHNELDKINLINNNMIQMIEFEAKTIRLNKQKMDIADTIHLSVALFQGHCTKRSIQVNLPEHYPMIEADADLLQKVMDNLLDNADKFSSLESEIDIRVFVETEHLGVSVENLSAGIEKEEINQLFKKFYRGKKVKTEQGLGLGLTVCQRIIEAHGGKIWAENIDSKGIVAFRFLLPVR